MALAPRHLRIFLASPGDVVDEREIALAVLDDLPYDPLLRGKITIEDVAWDKRGAGAPILAGMTPQDSIAAGLPRPSECDIVVVIFWSRMGTPLPASYRKAGGSRYESGTEWEYEDAVNASRTHGAPYVLLYRRKQPVTVDLDHPDLEEWRAQREKVKRFFDAFRDADGSSTSGYAEYEVPGDFRALLEHDLKSLIARILEKPYTGSATSATLPEPWKGSPFPGLRAFTADDAPIFFGREREIDALLARIHDHSFVAVVGASGSGKSSLIAAGVIPRLRLTVGGAGAEEWVVLQLTPDRLGSGDPFASLAAAILHALPRTQQKGLAAKLREDPDLLAALLPRWTLVFVDQFEELFTTIQPSLRVPFIETLQRVWTIVTVRADFYGHCVEIPALARLVENSTFPLAAPGVAALYDMITRPAARAALTFEDGLAQRILDDTGQEPGALALMAYMLDELHRRGLTHAAYEELGGVHGAIGKRSESVFAALGEEEQAALPRVFRELVEVDERGTATRQRAPLARVAASPVARRLTDALTDARLLTQSRGAAGEPVVEVAHEALFRSWTRLAEWTRGAADDLRLLRQVRMAAVEWEHSGRRDDFLWSHERLAPVYALRERLNAETDNMVADFIRPEYERIATAMRSGLSEARERAAIERLAEIGPSAAQALVTCLQYARNDETRSDAYRVLSRLGDVAVPHLLETIRNGKGPWREHAVTALTYVDPSAGKHLLSSLLVDEDSPVLHAAALLVAHARAAHEIPTLSGLLQKGVMYVRRAALVAVATFDAATTLDSVVAVIERDLELRFTAIALITDQITDQATEEPISEDPLYNQLLRLIGRNPVFRTLAALIRITTALASLPEGRGTQEKRILTALTRLLNRERIEESISTSSSDSDIDKLFLVMNSTNSPAIVDLLFSADPRLRDRAARSIRDLAAAPDRELAPFHLGLSLTAPAIRERLSWLLHHHERHVRDAVKDALYLIEQRPLLE